MSHNFKKKKEKKKEIISGESIMIASIIMSVHFLINSVLCGSFLFGFFVGLMSSVIKV